MIDILSVLVDVDQHTEYFTVVAGGGGAPLNTIHCAFCYIYFIEFHVLTTILMKPCKEFGGGLTVFGGAANDSTHIRNMIRGQKYY